MSAPLRGGEISERFRGMTRGKREIQRRRVHEDIVNYLLEDINDSVYKVGEELPSERDLMEEFHVGRPAVRESLMKLERMGVIETRPGVRAKVCEPSVFPLLEEMGSVVRLNMRTSAGQKEILETRLFFENALVRIAAKQIDAAGLQKLRDVLDVQKAFLDDMPKFSDTDQEFHGIIAAISEIPMVVALYQNMGKWLLDQHLKTLAVKGQAKRAYAAHEEIYAAISAHDPDAAETAMTAHLTQVETIYVDKPRSRKK